MAGHGIKIMIFSFHVAANEILEYQLIIILFIKTQLLEQ